MSCFIVFTGLPGAGKSRVAEALERALNIPVFAKDWLEAAIRRCEETNQSPPNLGSIGYGLLTALASRQLYLGQSVILDSVASTESIRAQWRELAARHRAQWRVIECICLDASIHRTRLEQRQRSIPGWPELSWAEVERVQAYCAPWTEDRLGLDMINSFDENMRQLCATCLLAIKAMGR